MFQGETRRGRMFPYLDDANCRGLDPELFYAESGAAIMKAKSLCAACPVREKCLEWAIKREEFGVWGGTTARERASLRREPCLAERVCSQDLRRQSAPRSLLSKTAIGNDSLL